MPEFTFEAVRQIILPLCRCLCSLLDHIRLILNKPQCGRCRSVPWVTERAAICRGFHGAVSCSGHDLTTGQALWSPVLQTSEPRLSVPEPPEEWQPAGRKWVSHIHSRGTCALWLGLSLCIFFTGKVKLTSSEHSSLENEWLVSYSVLSVCHQSLDLSVAGANQGLAYFVKQWSRASSGSVGHSLLLLRLFWEEALLCVRVIYAAPGSMACGLFSVASKNVFFFSQSNWVKSTSWQSRVSLKAQAWVLSP